MKTILVIEHDTKEREVLIDVCRQGKNEFKISSAQNFAQAQTILTLDRVDLIICSTRFPDSEEYSVIRQIANDFRYIPIIAISEDQHPDDEKIQGMGICTIHSSPIIEETLIRNIDELIEQSSTGTVKGIPISSFLQMLENDGDSCTMCVTCKQKSGYIYLSEGSLVGAATNSLTGEKAVYEMISWEDVVIEIRFFNGLKNDRISKPLISLIMEGLRLKDEKEEQKKQQQELVKPQHNLKQISTVGHRLALDIGLRLKMEFDSIESHLDSTLVGMVPDKCIITSTPSHFLITKTEMVIGNEALIKFTYMGKLCMFTSTLIKTIETPEQLLFFEYPKVIHYHEMRKAKRTAIYIPCSINLLEDGKYSGTIIDISSTGSLCQLKAVRDEPLPLVNLKQSIELSCILPGLTDEQTLAGTVRNIKTNHREIRIGIEFSNLGDQVKETISHF